MDSRGDSQGSEACCLRPVTHFAGVGGGGVGVGQVGMEGVGQWGDRGGLAGWQGPESA